MDRDLLIKSLKGLLTREEEAIVKEWLDASGEHRAYYARLRHLLFLRKRERVDVERNFSEFLRKSGKVYRRRLSQKIGYAAAVVVCVCVTVVALEWMHEKKWRENKQVNSFEFADNDMVFLEVGDKEVMVMNKADKREIQMGAGVTLQQNHAMVDYSVAEDSVCMKPERHVLNVPHGGEFELALEDGSRVWVNSETRLEYMVPFEECERRVKLKGEAYFQVKKSDKPFIVEFDSLEVRVLGTEFNVKAYGDVEDFAATLVEGKIELASKDSSWFLCPDEQICMENGHLVVRKVDVEKYIAWRDGVFAFSNERLEDIMDRLARWYDIRVFYQNPEVKEVRFTGSINRYADVTLLLDKLEKMKVVDFEVSGNVIMVRWKRNL